MIALPKESSRPRVTVEMAREAFRVTGLKPLCLKNTDYKGGGCLFVALALQAGVEEWFVPWDWAHAEYGLRYVSGFVHAWDGFTLDWETDDEAALGYTDGLACRRALLESQPACVERGSLKLEAVESK